MILPNTLPGVPIVESPFFPKLSAAAGWTVEEQAIARSLNEAGYVVIDFPEPDLEAIGRRIVASLDARYEWAGWRKGRESPRLQDAWKYDEDVKRLACNARVLELLTRLYGRRPLPFQTLNFPVGTQQDVHTDIVHFSSVPERFMCGVWIAFEDTDENNGSLFYHPGTHRWPCFLNEHLDADAIEESNPYRHYDRYVKMWKQLVETAGIPAKPFHARAGQAVIWAANLLHGGELQRDLTRTRHSQVTHYYFEGCCYYTPLLSHPFFGRISFDALVDIETGRTMQQTHVGRQVPEDFIGLATQGAAHGAVEFDAGSYLSLNPDIRASGVNPWEHWMRWGRAEGRRVR
jgi:hypothetical protein